MDTQLTQDFSTAEANEPGEACQLACPAGGSATRPIQIDIDCAELEALAAFWAQALDLPMTRVEQGVRGGRCRRLRPRSR